MKKRRAPVRRHEKSSGRPVKKRAKKMLQKKLSEAAKSREAVEAAIKEAIKQLKSSKQKVLRERVYNLAIDIMIKEGTISIYSLSALPLIPRIIGEVLDKYFTGK